MIRKSFSGRKLVIVSSHGEEIYLRPVLEETTGAEIMIITDPELNRPGSVAGDAVTGLGLLETARARCRAVAQMTGESLVMASQGGFGAHPTLGFSPVNEELLLLADFNLDAEYTYKLFSSETNIASNQYYDIQDALFFASMARFPSHGLTVRQAKNDFSEIHKDQKTWNELRNSISYFLNRQGKVFLETDMRASMNPSRGRLIRDVAKRLFETVVEPKVAPRIPVEAARIYETGSPIEMNRVPLKAS